MIQLVGVANDFADRIIKLEVCTLNWSNHMKQIRARPQGLFLIQKYNRKEGK